jgi:hypothetical protein
LNSKLKDALLSLCNQEFEVAWEAGGSRFMDLQAFASALATMMSTTSRVEGDYSDTTARRDFQCLNFSDFALEGVMHSKQLHQIQDTSAHITS